MPWRKRPERGALSIERRHNESVMLRFPGYEGRVAIRACRETAENYVAIFVETDLPFDVALPDEEWLPAQNNWALMGDDEDIGLRFHVGEDFHEVWLGVIHIAPSGTRTKLRFEAAREVEINREEIDIAKYGQGDA